MFKFVFFCASNVEMVALLGVEPLPAGTLNSRAICEHCGYESSKGQELKMSWEALQTPRKPSKPSQHMGVVREVGLSHETKCRERP